MEASELVMSIQTTPQTTDQDRQLLAAVLAWSRAAGWETGWSGPTWQSRDRLTGVDWEPDDEAVKVSRRDSKSQSWPLYGRWYPVTSTRQAIDLLVVLGVLPVELSSAYEAGRIHGLELGRAA